MMVTKNLSWRRKLRKLLKKKKIAEKGMEMPGRVYLFCLFGEKGDDITRPYWIESKGIAAVVQTFEL